MENHGAKRTRERFLLPADNSALETPASDFPQMCRQRGEHDEATEDRASARPLAQDQPHPEGAEDRLQQV